MLLRSSPPPGKLFFLPKREREWNSKASSVHLHRPYIPRLSTTSRASATSGYRKVPLGTPDACRLIDDDTGESVIIWGDPDEERFPPKEALFSTPSSGADSSSTASGGATTGVGRFTKLKAHKVRSLLARNRRGREHVPLHREGDGSSSVKTAVSEHGSESETEEEGEDEPFGAGDQVASRSNFLEMLREEGEDGMLEGDSDRVPPSSSSPGNVRRGGWSLDTERRHTSKQKRRKEPSLKDGDGFFSRRSFKELGCSGDIIKALRKQGFVRPSHIQALSYAHILEGKTCIIADQSGSGKTLAYLAPVIQCLRQEEILGIAKSTPKNPRVVILTPTAELASQVLSNCRSLAKDGVPFRSIIATGGFRQKTQLEGLQQELDILIATPGRFLYLLKEGFLELESLKSVVLDEVDILFSDRDFEDVLQNLIAGAPVTTRYLFVTATLPVVIYNKLVGVFPDSEVVMGPGIHRTSSGLEEVLVDCSGDGEEKNPDTAFANKKSSLLQLLDESPVDKTIVFCNKIETCRKIENALKRRDRKGMQIKVLPFHSALDQEYRLSNLREFLDAKTNSRLILVCTDRASRGIDFRDVDHVVLFDFPREPSEYVRRVGRAARGAGGKGTAFVFAVGKQVFLARRIIERNQKGHPLHDVPC